MDLNLREHVALVTGGASGIGRAIVEAFAEEGARVALCDVADAAGTIAEEISRRAGSRVIGFSMDVSDRAAVEASVQEAARQLGPIDHVVHAAAVGSGKFGFPFTNLTPEDWRRTLDVNVLGMVHVAHAVAPALMERRRGTLVFIASVAGQIGSQTDPPYSASKAANINFAQCMTRDLAPYGVRVNTVCPGMVQTPLSRRVWQAWHDSQPLERRRSYEDWAGEKVRKTIPLGTWQSPQNIADMVVFLSSDRASQVTGQTINVDGGYVMHW